MEKSEAKRRIVLVPIPEQGHVTPMMQLGKALNLQGFSITVVQTHSKQVISSQHFPGFQFVSKPESLPKSEIVRLGLAEIVLMVNKTSEASFKECISQLKDDIACIIYDEFMYFCAAAAKEFNLPSFIFTTQSAAVQVSNYVLNKLDVNKFLEDPEMQEKVVENMHRVRYMDLPITGLGPLGPSLELCREIVNKRTASCVIINTASCLESSSLSWLQQEVGIPVYPIGPLHVKASGTIPSLLEEDMSSIEWLDKQKPRSVIYISFGSVAQMETKELLEMAWGLCNSNQPFLWVIRPGSIPDSESLPEEVSEIVLEIGYIVKWAPQRQVLAHPAVGGFWSHCGWNSTLESISEGVPMICRPFQNEQKLNALYIKTEWRIGIQLEGELEREVVERAVKRLIVDQEGASMRERAVCLKDKLKASVTSGGSSYNAFDELVNYLNNG